MFKKHFVIANLILGLCACQPSVKPEQTAAYKITSGKPVTKNSPLVFPKDHGIHAEQGIEWWYLTANLQSDSGETFGVQWTLFRTLMPSHIQSKWWDDHLYFAHFAMQHEQKHVAFERFSRANQAKVVAFPFHASIDDWQLSSIHQNFLPLKLTAAKDNYAISLTLSDSPRILHGENGYSQKTQSGHASYYYSYPFLNVSGKLTFAGEKYQVTGNAWYDREWSASLLDKRQLGWDWFSIVDSKSSKKGLMLFCIRGEGKSYDYCSGTLIAPNGESTPIPHQNIQLSVVETVVFDNREYPSQWRVKLADKPDIIIDSITKDSRNQLTIPYWEGRVKATGGFEGKGYAELTGY
ncbi:lipocalin-like domain-containing protein [Algicola sagamiensis]|uniref:lipocalin-like domain-containing protein n=1 Tax=Algicola sagamiensis TaxID=163869 RepID=UPI00035F23A5|nr:lipocalin-like domain-containing protein [Algicola sagamiensis]